MPAFLSPLKSGTGVPAAAPETIIAGDYGQPVWQEEEEEQVIMQAGSTGEDLGLAAIVPLVDVAQEKSESLSPLSEKATHISFSQEEPSYSYTYTVISEQDDGHTPEQDDPEQEQQQQQQKGLTANTTEYLSTTIKEPVPTSLYPKGYFRQKPPSSSTGILSPPTQSMASSMADLSNNSSASITANMLAIKSHIFVQQDHQQPRLMPVVVVPIYQLSTPMSSTNSLSSPSRSASPVHHHYHHQPPFAKTSTPLTAQLGTTLETTPTSDGSITQRLTIPTIAKDEIRPGPAPSVKFSIANSRSGKGHSSNSSSCSWTSSLAPPSVDEMDPGKDLSGVSPSPAAPLPAAVPPISQRSQQHPTHHHDHSLSSVLDDLKCKTQNVLRKAGFSIAPEAGLFADRGSTKPADLKVIRLFPGSAAFLSRGNGGDRHGHMITDSKNSTAGSGSVSVSGVAATSTAKSTGFFGRPRSRSVRETSRPSLEVDAVLAQQQLQQKQQPKISDTTTTAVLTTSPTSIDNSPSSPPRPASSSSSSSMSVFKFERWPPWGGGHQRSSSGPARPSDWTIRPKRRMTVGLEHAHIVPNSSDRILDQHTSSSNMSSGGDHIRTKSGPLPPLPPLPTTLAPATIADERVVEERKKKKGHQRRVSDATTLTMTSARSAGASPQRFQLQNLQQQQQNCLPPSGTGLVLQQQTIPEKLPTPSPSKSMMGNWFGMVSKRRSFPSVEEEDPKRRFGYGGQQFHGFELAGVGSQRNSMIVLDDEDEDLDDLDEDSDLDEDEHTGSATGEEGGGGRTTPVGRVRKGRRRQVLVNDYGFICEPDENGGGGGDANHLHPPGELPSGSMVSELAARLSEPGSFLAEHERKRNLKKQYEFNRVSEAKWIQAMSQLQPDQVKKLTKFKKLARGGVPTSIRGRVWQFLANVNHYREPGLFQDLLSRGHLPIHDVIARDVHRCYPDHVHFRDGMGGTGQEDLHSILKAYAHYKPSVGYCQGMGRLVGMMLMQMPVEEAFWLLVATLEDGYLNDYFTPTLRQLRIDALVFERLLKAQDPRLAQHLHTNDVSPIMYITPWFLTLFTLSLPWASVLRVWDVFYFDGVKTLFRIGLGILQICRSTLLESCPSSAECMDFLLHVPLERLGPEVLLDRTAFRIRLRRESLEKMSLLTAGELDAKDAASRKPVASSSSSASPAAAMTGTGTGTGIVGEKQQQQQLPHDEDEDKKKNKRSMIASLRGVKAISAVTALSTSPTTTATTATTALSSPPTSANSIRTTRTHATTSSRTDNVVTFVEPTTTPTSTAPTFTTTTTTMESSATTASDMNQEAPSPADPDHDSNTTTINNNHNMDLISQTNNDDDDTHHNDYSSRYADKNRHDEKDDDANVERSQAESVKGTGTRTDRKHMPPPPPLLIATTDINKMTNYGSSISYTSSSRPNSGSGMRTATHSPSSPSLSHRQLPPLPQSPSTVIVPLPPIPPTTSTSSSSFVGGTNNNNNGLSGFSPLGVFKTRKRAGTHV
ncbi:hypothetical protein BGZ96_002443 [Linnemannia gamsii]|uniref:Rab-GAP TBC domain-containing protein n=1 Tax=Linnemannia gamsii TaxID=64522 RepID=A0ABQ7JKT3_9FUNG|nr:hypothetical protein BGZ96_002443 [Linnemannia gamsii]